MSFDYSSENVSQKFTQRASRDIPQSLAKETQERPLVSVIIPTYNRKEYLRVALQSAVNQTYTNIEIIVSDNCSDQNPQSLVESFHDPRIRFYRNSENIGMFLNAMGAFKRARGTYVASLLDDDMWEPDFLEKMVPCLEQHPNVAIAFCDHYIITETGDIDWMATQHCSTVNNRIALKRGLYFPFHREALVSGAISPAMAAVIRRDSIDWDSIPPEVGSLWDAYICYRSCCSGMGAYYVPERLTRVREHGQTITMLDGRRNVQGKIRKSQAKVFCYEKFMNDRQLKIFQNHFQKKWLNAHTTFGIGLMRNRQLQEARKKFSFVLRKQFDTRTFISYLISLTPPSLASRF